MSRSTEVGTNCDGKREYYVPSMPNDLVLLCGHAYASEGAAILHKDGGVVVSLTSSELKDLKKFVDQFPKVKLLKVRNRTYEIDHLQSAAESRTNLQGSESSSFIPTEEANSNTSTRFFNTKVNVSNDTERVMTLLLHGLSFNDLYVNVKNNSLDGLPPDVNLQMLNHFEHKYGRMPDIIRFAIPYMYGNKTGLMGEKDELTHVGQRVEIDVLESDYNDEKSTFEWKSKKLATHGGAIAMAIAVDAFSGYVFGKLLKSVANSIDYIKSVMDEYNLQDRRIDLIAADSGVISQSKFEVLTPKTVEYLTSHKIKTERIEPRNHSRGGSHVERAIRSLKELTRMAMAYLFRNPNFESFGFSKIQILKLWGEIKLWAIAVTNFKPSPRDHSVTKFQSFKNTKPNMQVIRLLPIFSVVFVPVQSALKGSQSNQSHNVVSLYVGPSLKVPGAIRAAIVTNGVLSVIVTSRYSPATDGGGLHVHDLVTQGTAKLIKEMSVVQNEKAVQTVLNDIEDPLLVSVDSGTVKKRGQKPKKQVSINEENILETKMSQETSQINKEKMLEQEMNKADTQNDIPQRVAMQRGPVVSPRRSPRGHHSSNIVESKQRKNSRDLIQAYMADWSTYNHSIAYFSFMDYVFFEIREHEISEGTSYVHVTDDRVEHGYKAVTQNVPRSFQEALVHPIWGEPARRELNTLLATKAIVEVNSDVARIAIRKGANLVILFPVYEQKDRDGVTVFKVRLVGDGRTHYDAGNTYSATPSREEFYILLHVLSCLGWDYAHVDENRAFLTAKYQGDVQAFAKFRGNDDEYYEILGALYGLRSSPRDYQNKVASRFSSLGYRRLAMCSCIYIWKDAEQNIVIIYDFVDDFVFTGNKRELLEEKIKEFRTIAVTTEPLWDCALVLGLELKRIRERNIILVTMSSKIVAMCEVFDVLKEPTRRVPIPVSGYIVKDYEFDTLPESRSVYLDKKGISKYMCIVGGLIWISGVRIDILFAVMYLSWFTKQPRQHHMNMSLHVLSYLYNTRDLPLVLGGTGDIGVLSASDASLGTAPKCRSICAHTVKLNPKAGAVTAKIKASTSTITNSFEAELDSAANALKSISKVKNVIKEFEIYLKSIPILQCDNLAMLEFINGQGVAKGVRHMELRMWYLREAILKQDIKTEFVPGVNIVTDKMTKLAYRVDHNLFRYDVMGHGLLEGLADYLYLCLDVHTEGSTKDQPSKGIID